MKILRIITTLEMNGAEAILTLARNLGAVEVTQQLGNIRTFLTTSSVEGTHTALLNLSLWFEISHQNAGQTILLGRPEIARHITEWKITL